MAKKKKSRRQFTIPLAVVAPLAINFVTPMNEILKGNAFGAARQIGDMFTGLDIGDPRPWRIDAPLKFYGMLFFGVLIHKFLGKAINPILGRAKVPIIRI